MTERQRLATTLGFLAVAFLVGFTAGVLCQATRAEADERISGGTYEQHLVTAVVLTLRADLGAVVTSVTFVPRASLRVNTDLAWLNPHCNGQCVGENDAATGVIRMAGDFPWTIPTLAEKVAHEAAHLLFWRLCRWCTTDELAVDACASDVRLCYEGARKP